MNQRPPEPSFDPAGANASQSVVLRDVAVRGQVLLSRPRTHETRASAPTVVPVQAQGRAEPTATPQPASNAVANANDDEASARRGYEEGLEQGRAQAAEEARQAAARADQSLQKTARDLELRFEKELQALRDRAEQEQTTLKARLHRLDMLFAALPAQVEARLVEVEDDMLALCFESITRILGAHAATPDGIRAQIAQARAGLRGQPLVAVHLHPDDLSLLRDAVAAAGGTLPSEDSELQWIADPTVALGGCILRSPQGGLDSRLETQLRALAGLLAQSRAAARAAIRLAGER